MPNPNTRTKAASRTKKAKTTKPTKRRTSSRPEKINLSPELREEMIREAAYYRAEKRGFEGGDPLTDWLASEEEVCTALSQGVH